MEDIKSAVMHAMAKSIAAMVDEGASTQELEMAINQSKKVIDALKEDEAE